ncbi:hypothetical protein NL676_014730 [Syzygium grande]|nr:hypothetical protein NL676_014730 [Syzygium grande]
MTWRVLTGLLGLRKHSRWRFVRGHRRPEPPSCSRLQPSEERRNDGGGGNIPSDLAIPARPWLRAAAVDFRPVAPSPRTPQIQRRGREGSGAQAAVALDAAPATPPANDGTGGSERSVLNQTEEEDGAPAATQTLVSFGRLSGWAAVLLRAPISIPAVPLLLLSLQCLLFGTQIFVPVPIFLFLGFRRIGASRSGLRCVPSAETRTGTFLRERMAAPSQPPRIGLAGLAVMGQNLALNIAEKGFPISVYNRTTSKVDETVERAEVEGGLPVYGFHDPQAFVNSIQKPRVIIMLVKAGAPVDQTIKTLSAYMEEGDCIIDGGNEWYENTERREKAMAELGLLYLGMGVSGGEEGARHGPSLMPGGSFKAFKYIEDILLKVAAQVPDSGPCVTYVGKGGSGNFVKMVHNGIEYGDMQLIAEAYDVLRSVGKLSNEELKAVFSEWNDGELQSFLIEITADIFGIKDDKGEGYLVDKVLDKTGMKGTGKWTVQQAADLSVAAPTIAASLDSRFLSGLKEERVKAAKVFEVGGFGDILVDQEVDKKKLIDDVRQALYASKICSYAQGMNLIRAKSIEKGWDLTLGELARIWKGGCIIRAIFLDRIKKAYDRNADLANLLVDPEFAKEIIDRQSAWRRVVSLAINSGISVPGMSSSLAYFDTYRRARVPANLVQAQRDYFGAHTYERVDMEGSFHTEWFKIAKQSNI